jgi:RNA polymerase sigma-70 factor (ECF subfamily)
MRATLAGALSPAGMHRQARSDDGSTVGTRGPTAVDGRENVIDVPWVPTVGGEAYCQAPSLEHAYRLLAPAVLGYFRSHRAMEPEDLVGDVFVGAARGLHRFRGDDADLRRWVFTIAHRRLIDDRRRRVARPQSVVPEPPDMQAFDQSAALDPDLVDALLELTPLQREVVVLRFVADLPLAAVAGIVQRRVGAVKGLQSRALAQLAHRLSGG